MPAVPITTRRAAWLSVLWLAAGLALGLVVLASLGTERAVNYWSVYVLERSLSLDNVFCSSSQLACFAAATSRWTRVAAERSACCAGWFC